MKVSFYNVFSFIEENKYIIYNTLFDNLFVIDEKIKNNMEKEEFEKIPDKIMLKLKKYGMVQENDFCEVDFYKFHRDKCRFTLQKTHILLTITDKCNCECTYCFARGSNAEGSLDHLSSEKIRKFIIRSVIENHSKMLQIDFFGGEPFTCWKQLTKEILFFNEWCDRNNVISKYRFYTNGTILSPEIEAFLIQNRSRIKDIQVTLDGPKEIHDQLRPLKTKKSCYDNIMESLIRYNNNSIPVAIRINFDKNSYNHIPLLLDNLIDRGLKNIPISVYAVQAMTRGCSGYEQAVSDDDTTHLFPWIWEECLKRGFRLAIRPKTRFVYCTASCNSTFVLDYIGNIYKCALLQTEERFKVGKITDDGKISNISNEFYRWFSRDPLEFDSCKLCKLLPVCGGGCAGSAAFKYGTYKINNCFDYNTSLIEERLRLYYKYSLKQQI